VEVGEGHASFELDPAERHYNPLGTVHGGIAATLLDSAMGCAVHTTLNEGEAYRTLELKVNYVRAITEATGRVVAAGSVIHRGGRLATAEARLTDKNGRLLAQATRATRISATTTSTGWPGEQGVWCTIGGRRRMSAAGGNSAGRLGHSPIIGHGRRSSRAVRRVRCCEETRAVASVGVRRRPIGCDL